MKGAASAAWLGAFLAAAAAAGYASLPAPAPRREPSPLRPAPTAMPAPASLAAAPAATAVSALGLTLYGVTGGGAHGRAAIIGSSAGDQRLVPRGRDYRPGLRVAEVGLDYAILDSGGAPARLELKRFGAPAPAGAPRIDAPEAERRIEAAVLRHILKPVAANGRIGGYALKGGESLKQLDRAGLRPGDVIVAVNGSRFDEERMGELAWEMRNSSKTELVFIRNGKRMKASI